MNEILNLSEYSQEVQQYLLKLENHFIKNYGCISPEWNVSIRLIADNYQFYLDCKEQIRKDGLMMLDSKGRLERHPLLPTLNAQQGYLMKLSHQFGLSIMSNSKLTAQHTSPIETDTDSFIDNLCS